MLSRRSFLAASAVAMIPVSLKPEKAVGEYAFKKECLFGNDIARIYSKQELDTCSFLDSETFGLVQPIEPILVERQIAVMNNGNVRTLPSLVVSDQRVECILVHSHKRVWITV